MSVEEDIQKTVDMLNKLGYVLVLQNKTIKVKQNNDEHDIDLKKILKTIKKFNSNKRPFLGSLIFLALCKIMKRDKDVSNNIKNSEYWYELLKTQNYCMYTGLTWTGNSCYQDSVFMSLFAIPNEFVNEEILKKEVKNKNLKAIQTELNNITNNIRNENSNSKTCSVFRSLIKKYNTKFKHSFHTTKMQDASEFLIFLFDIFNVRKNNFLTKTLKIYNKNTNPFIVTERTELIDPIISISSYSIYQHDTILLSSFLETTTTTVLDKKNLYKYNNNTYSRKIDKDVITLNDFAIFNVNRLLISEKGEKRIYTKIIPDEKIQNLKLYAICVSSGLHYTCYFKCQEIWFYYNDLTSNIKHIGSYNNMLDSKPNPTKEGTLYFYSK